MDSIAVVVRVDRADLRPAQAYAPRPSEAQLEQALRASVLPGRMSRLQFDQDISRDQRSQLVPNFSYPSDVLAKTIFSEAGKTVLLACSTVFLQWFVNVDFEEDDCTASLFHVVSKHHGPTRTTTENGTSKVGESRWWSRV